MKMNLEQMKDYTESFLREAYGMKLDVPVKINGRLSRTLGQFVYNKREKKPISIEMSKKYLVNGKLEDIKSTLRHEAIHYALFVQGRDYRDGDDDFENELKKHNTHSTGTVHYKRKRLKVTHECGCGNQWIRQRSMNNKYMCASCETTIKEVKREYVYR